MSNEEKIFDPFDRMSFSYENCFLCGISLDVENSSEEHVFPRWLQDRYNLWDKTITLLNGTRIPYRMLKIPCCNICNNQYLSNMENTIKQGLEEGYDSFINIDRKVLFQWISKIFYGLLFKELSLNYDRRDPSIGTITTPDLLNNYKMTHTFLQSVRFPIQFEDFQPWSIHILEGQETEDGRNFHYLDGLHTLTFSINLESVMIFAHLQDNGIHEELKSDYFRKLKNCKLHNIQFLEIAVKNLYSSNLLSHSPYYLLHGLEDKNTPLTIYNMSSYYHFNEWDDLEYAKICHYYMSQFYGIELENIYSKQLKRASTFIRNDDGSFNYIPSEARLVFK